MKVIVNLNDVSENESSWILEIKENIKKDPCGHGDNVQKGKKIRLCFL